MPSWLYINWPEVYTLETGPPAAGLHPGPPGPVLHHPALILTVHKHLPVHQQLVIPETSSLAFLVRRDSNLLIDGDVTTEDYDAIIRKWLYSRVPHLHFLFRIPLFNFPSEFPQFIPRVSSFPAVVLTDGNYLQDKAQDTRHLTEESFNISKWPR